MYLSNCVAKMKEIPSEPTVIPTILVTQFGKHVNTARNLY